MASKQAKIIHAKRIATPKEATTMIGDFVPEKEPSFRGAAIIYDQDTGELVAAHLPVQNTRQLRQELVGEKFDKISRASAFSSDSKTFGYAPRRHIIGREGCAPSRSRRDNPHLDSLLGGLADECADSMTDFAPNIVEKDRETLRQIKPEWRLGERKLWSSGVINKTAQLPYHRDTFNFPAWSAMPVLRRGVRGGICIFQNMISSYPARTHTLATSRARKSFTASLRCNAKMMILTASASSSTHSAE